MRRNDDGLAKINNSHDDHQVYMCCCSIDFIAARAFYLETYLYLILKTTDIMASRLSTRLARVATKSALPRAPRSQISRSFSIQASSATQLPQPFTAPRCLRQPLQKRWHSSAPTKSKSYDFQKVCDPLNTTPHTTLITLQIKEVSSKPSSDLLLVDVREPHEYEAGFIPTAINIPITSNPDALLLPAEEFEDRFGFAKPDVNKEVVFYCKAGVRSSAAAQVAEQGGYQKIAEYRGSWLDWQRQGGQIEKP